MRDRLPMIFSTTALLIAVFGATPLGKAAYNAAVPRNSVGSLQLKRNAVTSSKIAPNAIRGSQIVDGSLLTGDFKAGQIPQGPKGDKGTKGDNGTQGPPGLAERQTAQTTSAFDSTNSKQISVKCPAGKVAVGGGAFVNGAQVAYITASSPSIDGWAAHAIEPVASSASWNVTAVAICAKVGG
jgi:hypothetical protein